MQVNMDAIEEIISVHDSFMLGQISDLEVEDNLKHLFQILQEDYSKQEIKKIIMSLELEDEFEETAFSILEDV